MLYKLQTLARSFWQWLPVGVRVRAARSTQQKFTVSTTGIIINGERKVLLLEHVLRPGSGWALPGGFLNAGEQPADGLIRELREETGLEVVNVRSHFARLDRRHIEIFFTAEPIGEAVVKSREIMDLGWFSFEELPTGMSRHQIRLIAEVLAEKV